MRAEELLETAGGRAEAIEVHDVIYETAGVKLTDGMTKKVDRKQENAYSVRVIKDGHVGFSAAAGAEPPKDLVERALESARFGSEARFEFPGRGEPESRPSTYDAAVESLTFEAARRTGEKVCALLKEKYPDALVEAGAHWIWGEETLVNSSGAVCRQRFSNYSVSAMVQRVRGEEITIVFCGKNALAPQDALADRVVEVILERLDAAQRVATIESGPKKVLFDPSYGVFAILMPLFAGLNGENVARGTSPLCGKVGEPLLSELLTIVDDPTMEGAAQSRWWDAEGLPAKRNVLVDGGTLRSFVFDLENAARAGMEPTASARRGFLSRPKPGFSNFVVETGETPLEEMISSVDEGLYVINPLSAWGANPLSGRFSTPLGLALKIEKGEIVGRVRQVSIAGNVYEDLKRVLAVSREAEWFGGRLVPHILVDGVSVTAK